jgi:hypothetical protein
VFRGKGGVSTGRLLTAVNRPLLNGKDTPPMNKDNVIDLKKPEQFIDDQITAIIRQGTHKLLAQALETEIMPI